MIGQFGLKLTKTAHDGSIWIRIYQNDPWLANLGPNWTKRSLISQFGIDQIEIENGIGQIDQSRAVLGSPGLFFLVQYLLLADKKDL